MSPIHWEATEKQKAQAVEFLLAGGGSEPRPYRPRVSTATKLSESCFCLPCPFQRLSLCMGEFPSYISPARGVPPDGAVMGCWCAVMPVVHMAAKRLSTGKWCGKNVAPQPGEEGAFHVQEGMRAMPIACESQPLLELLSLGGPLYTA